MKKNQHNWYGTWVWDYLNLERSDIADEAWESYDIWKRGYIQANPELSELDDLELIEYYYTDEMRYLFDSWLFKAWRLFYLPSQMIRALVWKIKTECHEIRGIQNDK